MFLEQGVPANVVNFAEEMADDPQVAAMAMVVNLEHAVTGPQRTVGPLFRMSVSPTHAEGAAPPLGHHTREILLAASVTELELQELTADGAIGLAGC